MTSRRHFLRGAAGFTLALPFLESLLPKRARAGQAPYAAHPRFVCMTTQHGGIWGANMFPGDGVASTPQTLYPGHAMHYGQLAASSQGAMNSLSAVLTADASRLSANLVSKMSVIRGIDVPYYLGHHTGGDLGNYARNDGEDGSKTNYRPTIDQVLAYSDTYYGDLASLRERSMHIGTHPNHTWGWSNPTQQTGTIEALPLSQSSLALFSQIFVPEDDPNAPEPRPLVVDRVLESYNRLRSGAFGDAAKLGAADRQRLDEHIDRLHDLESRLNAVASCGDVPQPTGDTANLDVGGYSANVADMRAYYQLYNDVIVAAFICGTSRIAVINSGETWSQQNPGLCCDWHDNVAHMSAEPDGAAQSTMVAAKRDFFDSVFLDLVNKLDVEESNGVTYLDNSFVFWTQEAGSTTHDQISLPIVAAGGAAGVFETGQYIDYRNREDLALAHDYRPEYLNLRPGISHSRFLATVLQSMGLPPEEFEYPGETGYGMPLVSDAQVYPQAMLDDASEMLPVLTKT